MTHEQETLITRIREMENRYHEVKRMLEKLDTAIEEYNGSKEGLTILKDYMESGQWLKDYEADEAGQIPADLEREVLSQDALYDLLSRAYKMIASARASFQ